MEGEMGTTRTIPACQKAQYHVVSLSAFKRYKIYAYVHDNFWSREK